MFRNILVPVDISDEQTWRKQINTAVDMARQSGATLHIMSVVPSYSSPLVGSFFPKGYEQEMLTQAREELARFVAENVPDDVRAEPVVAIGSIYEEVILAAKQFSCDLIILGRSSSSKTNFLLGPNAARVVRHTRTSVMVTEG